MNNPYINKKDLTSLFVPLAAERTVVTVTITSPVSNGNTVYLAGQGGVSVPLEPGEWHTFKSVDLADIQVKGTAGDIITIIGGTW